MSDTAAARHMLDTFTSVGAQSFAVTKTERVLMVVPAQWGLHAQEHCNWAVCYYLADTNIRG